MAAFAVAVALGACQTTGDGQPPGAVVGGVGGGVYGATYGAFPGNGIGPGAGSLIGVIVGAIAGHMIIGEVTGGSFSTGDIKLAEDTARRVAEDPTLNILHWESKETPRAFGWSEPVTDDSFGAPKNCRLIRSVRFIGGIATNERRRYCLEDGSWMAGEKLSGV